MPSPIWVFASVPHVERLCLVPTSHSSSPPSHHHPSDNGGSPERLGASPLPWSKWTGCPPPQGSDTLTAPFILNPVSRPTNSNPTQSRGTKEAPHSCILACLPPLSLTVQMATWSSDPFRAGTWSLEPDQPFSLGRLSQPPSPLLDHCQEPEPHRSGPDLAAPHPRKGPCPSR